MRKRIRMKDIARDLKVSIVTVSKALRNHDDISIATRQRVLDRVRELNYQPNWAARTLATQRSYIVGFVVPDLMISFFAEISKGITERLAPLGYHVVISHSQEDPEIEKQEIERLLARQIDGLIIASAQRRADKELFASFETRRVPYVLIDRTLPGIRSNYVGIRDEEIGALATEHLIEQGCRQIAHIRGPMLSTGTGRLRGYRKALAHHGLELSARYVVNGQWGKETGYLAMRELLKLDPPPDGVFCYNDGVAAGAIMAAIEAGLKVPNDVAIIGAANVHYSDVFRVPLSTIDQSSVLIGEKAAELLVRLIEAKTPPPPEQIIIPPRLVVRGSSRRVPHLC
jgi:LacI family transcriptional regulator, galactose operon repressor